jgi:hypothetical protein
VPNSTAITHFKVTHQRQNNDLGSMNRIRLIISQHRHHKPIRHTTIIIMMMMKIIISIIIVTMASIMLGMTTTTTVIAFGTIRGKGVIGQLRRLRSNSACHRDWLCYVQRRDRMERVITTATTTTSCLLLSASLDNRPTPNDNGDDRIHSHDARESESSNITNTAAAEKSTAPTSSPIRNSLSSPSQQSPPPPPPPWPFHAAHIYYQLRWMKADIAAKHCPPAPPTTNLYQLSIFGYTLGGIFCIEYANSPIGPYREVAILSSLVGMVPQRKRKQHPQPQQVLGLPQLGAWASHIYVDSNDAAQYGTKYWGLPATVVPIEMIASTAPTATTTMMMTSTTTDTIAQQQGRMMKSNENDNSCDDDDEKISTKTDVTFVTTTAVEASSSSYSSTLSDSTVQQDHRIIVSEWPQRTRGSQIQQQPPPRRNGIGMGGIQNLFNDLLYKYLDVSLPSFSGYLPIDNEQRSTTTSTVDSSSPSLPTQRRSPLVQYPLRIYSPRSIQIILPDKDNPVDDTNGEVGFKIIKVQKGNFNNDQNMSSDDDVHNTNSDDYDYSFFDEVDELLRESRVLFSIKIDSVHLEAGVTTELHV